MSKTMAERIREMAEILSQKAHEIREKIQGSDSIGNTSDHQEPGK